MTSMHVLICTGVMMFTVAGHSGEGAVDSTDRVLQRLQRGVLWDAVQRLLEAEAAAADAGGSGHVLAAQLVQRAVQQSPRVSTAALGPLLLCRYLKTVDGAPPPPKLPGRGCWQVLTWGTAMRPSCTL